MKNIFVDFTNLQPVDTNRHEFQEAYNGLQTDLNMREHELAFFNGLCCNSLRFKNGLMPTYQKADAQILKATHYKVVVTKYRDFKVGDNLKFIVHSSHNFFLSAYSNFNIFTVDKDDRLVLNEQELDAAFAFAAKRVQDIKDRMKNFSIYAAQYVAFKKAVEDFNSQMPIAKFKFN